MKKYIYNSFIGLLSVVAVWSCTAEEGSMPGNDANPSVLIYQYPAARPANPDNDIVLRFATNNKVNEAYYLSELTSAKESRVASMGEDGYMDYVVQNGTKLDLSKEGSVDVTMKDLYGAYTITAVAVNGNQKASSESTFEGLDWTDVVKGTYHFTILNTRLGLTTTPTVLQVCTTDAGLYRFKDVFGEGYSMKINLIDQKGSDSDGTYTFFRVPSTDTPYTYGNYGTVYVRDIGYWQGSDAWVTSNGYESGMYEDYSCFVFVQYYVSGGNLGYDYDFFVPD
ncbi:MAG: hypothetical protein LBM62_10485 [Mediterranea sp.]|jgi:hypothetical protein|nr:hypothetical protein [Mediterranea sp.]